MIFRILLRTTFIQIRSAAQSSVFQVSMTLESSFNNITRHNFDTEFSTLEKIILESKLISIDCEFSGLGDLKKTRESDMDIRYQNLRAVCQSRSLVSLGMSVESPEGSIQNFNFPLLQKEPYMIDPSSYQFLAENKFDFSFQALQGIRFSCISRNIKDPMSKIIALLIKAKKQLVVHNGLLDLMFLYHSFHADLPDKLESFVADLSALFPSGIWDTKYLCDYVDREDASFLAYVYRK